MKKFIALVLALVMVLSLSTVAFATYEENNRWVAIGSNDWQSWGTVFKNIFKGINFSSQAQEIMGIYDQAVGAIVADCANIVQDVVVFIDNIMNPASEATIPFTTHHWKNNDFAQAVHGVLNDIEEYAFENHLNEDLQSAISWFFTFNGFRVVHQFDN